MKYIFRITLILFSFNCFSQNSTCLDFKTGVFYINLEIQPPLLIKIIRDKDTQIEIVMNLIDNPLPNVREKTFETIEWIDECSFRLKYDTTKMELNDTEKSYNDNGGVLVKFLQPIGKCFEYESTSVYKGKSITYRSKICKE